MQLLNLTTGIHRLIKLSHKQSRRNEKPKISPIETKSKFSECAYLLWLLVTLNRFKGCIKPQHSVEKSELSTPYSKLPNCGAVVAKQEVQGVRSFPRLIERNCAHQVEILVNRLSYRIHIPRLQATRISIQLDDVLYRNASLRTRAATMKIWGPLKIIQKPYRGISKSCFAIDGPSAKVVHVEGP
jgi:hypothetical protein